MTTKRMRLVLAGLIATAGAVAGATQIAAQIAALADLEPGEWQLKEIGGTETRTLCLADTGQLLQIQHGSANCTRHVLESGAKAVTVHYTCASGGNGRTTLSVRSPQSLKIETQGMAGGAPFAFDYDAKRIGDCPGAGPAALPEVKSASKPEPGGN